MKARSSKTFQLLLPLYIAATFVQAQDIAPYVQLIPTCMSGCLTGIEKRNNCATRDWVCICEWVLGDAPNAYSDIPACEAAVRNTCSVSEFVVAGQAISQICGEETPALFSILEFGTTGTNAASIDPTSINPSNLAEITSVISLLDSVLGPLSSSAGRAATAVANAGTTQAAVAGGGAVGIDSPAGPSSSSVSFGGASVAAPQSTLVSKAAAAVLTVGLPDQAGAGALAGVGAALLALLL